MVMIGFERMSKLIFRNFQVYGSGEKLCNTVWGDLFKYTTDEEHCVDPSDIKHNLDFVKSLNPSYEVNDCTVTPGKR